MQLQRVVLTIRFCQGQQIFDPFGQVAAGIDDAAQTGSVVSGCVGAAQSDFGFTAYHGDRGAQLVADFCKKLSAPNVDMQQGL